MFGLQKSHDALFHPVHKQCSHIKALWKLELVSEPVSNKGSRKAVGQTNQFFLENFRNIGRVEEILVLQGESSLFSS